MTRVPCITVSAVAELDAPPERVYALLADYRGGHPRILPAPYFEGLRVERGGVGAGTVITFRMRLGGRGRDFHADVTEPEPGRVLAEADRLSGAVTTFTVDGLGSGDRSRVTIATTWERPGLAGWVDRLMAPGVLRRVYEAELAQLARVASSGAA